MTDPIYTMSVSLHEHLLRLLADHEKLQDTELRAMERALVLARAEADKQYHMLNNLRKEYQEERGLFMLTAVHDAKQLLMDVEVRNLHKKLDELNGNFKLWGSVILALSFAFQLIGHFFWK